MNPSAIEVESIQPEADTLTPAEARPTREGSVAIRNCQEQMPNDRCTANRALVEWLPADRCQADPLAQVLPDDADTGSLPDRSASAVAAVLVLVVDPGPCVRVVLVATRVTLGSHTLQRATAQDCATHRSLAPRCFELGTALATDKDAGVRGFGSCTRCSVALPLPGVRPDGKPTESEVPGITAGQPGFDLTQWFACNLRASPAGRHATPCRGRDPASAGMTAADGPRGDPC
jgi:hypothetical protein